MFKPNDSEVKKLSKDSERHQGYFCDGPYARPGVNPFAERPAGTKMPQLPGVEFEKD